MRSITRTLTRFPEYYFILLAIGLGYKSSVELILIAVALIGILSFQLIYSIRVTGILIACLFGAGNVFFLLAMLSEFNEFVTFSSGAKQLLLGGLLIFIANSIFTILMVHKYAPNLLMSVPETRV